MSVIIRGASSNHGVEVTEGGRMEMALPTALINPETGFVKCASQSDNGDVTGEPITRELDSNDDYALRTAQDNLLFNKSFLSNNINTSIWKQTYDGMSISSASDAGFITLNTNDNTSIDKFAIVESYKSFQLLGSVSNYFAFRAKTTNTIATGKRLFVGAGLTQDNQLHNAFAFIWTEVGELRGAIINHGNILYTDAFEPMPDNENHYYLITYTSNSVEFWIDDILQASLASPVSFGSATGADSAKILFGVRNISGVSAPSRLAISNIQVLNGGPTFYRQQNIIQPQTGCGAYQGQTSWGSVESTANYQINAAPDVAVFSMTSPESIYDTLGGQFQLEVPDAAEFDYPLFGWRNPVSGVNVILEKQLIITGVRISSVNFGDTIAGSPVILEWSLGVGCTADNLETIEGIASKSPRIIPIGMQSFQIGAAAGVQAYDVNIALTSPAVVDPGQYCHIIVRVISGNSGTAQIIRGTCHINGYFE